jgi:hypothetical protein
MVGIELSPALAFWTVPNMKAMAKPTEINREIGYAENLHRVLAILSRFRAAVFHFALTGSLS